MKYKMFAAFRGTGKLSRVTNGNHRLQQCLLRLISEKTFVTEGTEPNHCTVPYMKIEITCNNFYRLLYSALQAIR
jgi:hypothetical protein